MKLLFTARFLRSYNKLTSDVQHDVENAVALFAHTENHEKLRVHKLRGKMKKYYAFSANFRYRVIIKIEKKNTYFMDVGDHSMYE